jgi:excisionase family DNA binding protein
LSEETVQVEDLQLLTPKQVAKLLGVTEVCVYQWARRRILPSFKVEKCVRFSKEDLRSFLESRRVEGR